MGKKVLIVFAHPNNKSSFNAELLRISKATCEAAGFDVTVNDLYEKNFQPVISMSDLEGTFSGQVALDVAEQQALVKAADIVIFHYPVFWFDRPAILKGWFDRVFTHGFAFTMDKGITQGCFADKKAIVIQTAGTSEEFYSKLSADQYPHVGIDKGTLSFCGFDTKILTHYNIFAVPSESRESMKAGTQSFISSVLAETQEYESKSDNEVCLEVAVFNTDNPNDELQRQANSIFSSYAGFIASFALVCTGDEKLRADLVIWASLKNALEGAETFKKDKRLSTYASSIKKLDTFGHYKTINAESFSKLADASIVELTRYKTLSKAAAELRQKMHESLMDTKEASINIPVNTVTEAFEETGITPKAIDITGWSSEEAYKNKSQTLFFHHPELKPLVGSQSDDIIISRAFRKV